MKKLILLTVLCIFIEKAFAQNQTFDHITFTASQGFKKNVEENIISYTITDTKKNSWCPINLIKCTVSK